MASVSYNSYDVAPIITAARQKRNELRLWKIHLRIYNFECHNKYQLYDFIHNELFAYRIV